ncbi:ETEC_3214 domain-containing protein [Streptomyces sp. NPDC051909]|uniref:ETEC_3214 domain-containing protein n=1 Tax=Streptomyces sp. NPDC051909 TaxID=3154944 RepID=UPI003436C6AC
MAGSEDRPSFTERLKRFQSENGTLTVLFFVASIVTALSTLATASVAGWGWWQKSHEDWRPAEYKKLNQLRSGQTIERFQELLGKPAYRKTRTDGKVSLVFHPRQEYWVDVTTDRTNTTLSYSVTSCSNQFRPTFRFRNGSRWPRVTLNSENLYNTLADEIESKSNGLRLKVFSATATSSEYAFQTYIGGNPTSYRTYAWGINDSCGAWTDEQKEIRLDPWDDWYLKHPQRQGGILIVLGTDLQATDYQMMKSSTPNTYAETAPGVDIDSVYPDQIGVDRIVIRP